MNGLALLCNLHADGPQTLRRLRQAGVHSVQDLERVPVESLARILRASPHLAQRFCSEARLLRQRIEGAKSPTALFLTSKPAVEESDRKVVAFTQASIRAELAAPRHRGQADNEKGLAPIKLPPGARRPEGYDLKAKPGAEFESLARRDTAPSAQTGTKHSEQSKLEEPVLGVGQRGARSKPTVGRREELQASLLKPAAKPSQAAIEIANVQGRTWPAGGLLHQGTPLRRGEIPGLDKYTLERLYAQGVRTYRELIETSTLALSRSSALSFTRLLELRYHARRFLWRRLMPASLTPASFQPGALKQRISSRAQCASEVKAAPETHREPETKDVILTPKPPLPARFLPSKRQNAFHEPAVSTDPSFAPTPGKPTPPESAGPFA